MKTSLNTLWVNISIFKIIQLQIFILSLLGGCGISMEGGLDRLGRIPGVVLGPGVESPRGVGVHDLSPGVPAFSHCKPNFNKTLLKYYL